MKEQQTILMDSIITQNKGSLIVHVSLTDASPFQIKASQPYQLSHPFPHKEINVNNHMKTFQIAKVSTVALIFRLQNGI